MISDKKTRDGKNVKIVTMFNYEYILIEVNKADRIGFPMPCFMGFRNFALTSCKRLSEYRKKLNKYNLL